MSDEQHCGEGGGHRHDITCREVSDFLLAYLEQDLDPDARAEFEEHLELCPPCVHYMDGYRETVALVRSCGRSEIDPDQRRRHKPPEDLIQAILRAKAKTDAEPEPEPEP